MDRQRWFDRPSVALALDGHFDCGRSSAGNADFRFLEHDLEVGQQRLNDDPVRETDAAAVFQVTQYECDFISAAGHCEFERRVGDNE